MIYIIRALRTVRYEDVTLPVVVKTIPMMEVATRAIPQAVLYGSLLLVYHTVNLYPVLLSGHVRTV